MTRGASFVLVAACSPGCGAAISRQAQYQSLVAVAWRTNYYGSPSMGLFAGASRKCQALISAYVVPESIRCVQCGICSYNCPLGINVRPHAWRGEPVKQSECLTGGECVRRCPRLRI